MRNKAFALAIVLIVPIAVALAHTAAAAKMSSSDNDMAITSAVQQKLESNAGLDSSHIRVETKDGEVTLKGVVPTEHDVNRAAKLASYVDGVRHVDNRLKTEKAVNYKATAPKPNCQIGANWEC